VPAWDDFRGEDPTREATRETLDAKVVVQAAVKGVSHEVADGGAEIRVLFRDRGYVMVVRGQSSAAGHGKQGLSLERARFLRELDTEIPVWLVFIEAGGKTYWSGWLRGLPDAHPISKVVGEERYGWNCRTDPDAWDAELVRGVTPLALPSVPDLSSEPNLFNQA
jgi:hypothetical protein